jgi:uncharacterized protein (TIGR03118 family)
LTQRKTKKLSSARRPVRFRPEMDVLELRALMSGNNFVQTNLVSDISGMAATTDAHLLNPWGMAALPNGPLWVSNNSGGTSTVYNGQGAVQSPIVTIPTNTITMPPTPGTPTGIVANAFGSGFDVTPGGNSAKFIFATQDGQIDAWAGGSTATVEVTNSSASYTGLAIGTDGNGDHLLYAANFLGVSIDVFDQNFNLVEGASGSSAAKSSITLPGSFTDPNLPAGYWPFNIQAIGGKLYVEYALPDQTTGEGLPGAHQGIIDVYSTDGVLLTPHHLIVGGALNAPWGITQAPAKFGAFSGDLLVGNFGDGHINAYTPTGAFVGPLMLANGQPFQGNQLWTLQFGNGATDPVTGAVLAPTNTLYFTEGLNNEADGLLGTLQAPATISSTTAILPHLSNTAMQSFSTVPANGDGNPYGVAFVPQGIKNGGELKAGDLLVSNFNSNGGPQGSGTTIQLITPDGQTSTFFPGPSGLGLNTALGVLKSGFVIVGNTPNSGGTTVAQGSLLILDGNGNIKLTLTDSALLQGPWDMTINDQGSTAQVFVSNVLSGTVTRINLSIPKGGTPIIESETQIASGYKFNTNGSALVVGPTGLAYDASTGTLFVASTDDNAIYAIANAATLQQDNGKGSVVVHNNSHLQGPLGLVLAPNGDLIVANGDAVDATGTPNELLEFTTSGHFVASFQIDSGNSGAAFGVALTSSHGVLRFAAVDDNTNTVDVWTLDPKPHHMLPKM